MDPDISLLITMVYHDSLCKVAIKTSDQKLHDSYQYWNEPDVKKSLRDALPLHCQLGPVVAVEKIFDIGSPSWMK